MDETRKLYPPADAAAYLADTPPATLQWWRTTGRGPKYVKIGRRVFYRQCDLDNFIAAGERTPEAAHA